ncbi:hypothetical protein DSO57_1032590 [Entomophthora muscae]|uniref:Uncharacterized protein n=1 Tax=Entomophthora muscae TaxID=34485 RepID=A0ACC2TBF7_9FUNG|nr:hypothetical protein DSO57_1032590 [Entomophthora muscae]
MLKHSQARPMSQHETLGKLEINAIQGRKLRNCETFSKQDPYLTYKLGESRGRTKTNRNGGTNPTWNEVTLLNVTPKTYKLRLRAYDDDLIGKDCIGEGTIDVSPAICKGELDGWFPIYSNSQLAGEVYLEFTFLRKV